MNVHQLQKSFLQFEKEHKAFNQKIFKDFYYWDIVRQFIYEELLGYYNFYKVTPVVPDSKFGLKNRLHFLGKLLQNEWSFFFSKKKRKIVFVSTSRNLNSEGFANDHLTQDYRDSLSPDEYIEMEIWYYAPYNKETLFKNRYFTYTFWLFNKFDFLIKRNIPKRVDYFIDEIESYFKITGAIDKDQVKKFITFYYISIIYYKWALKRIKPNLVIVSSCERYVAHACNDLNINNIELQHGTNSTIFNLPYIYNPEIDYTHVKSIFNTVFTFSDYWSVIALMPSKLISMGNNYLYSDYNPSGKKTSSVLVISNQDFTPIFLEPIKNLASELKDIKFYFKLHAAEYEYIDTVNAFFSDLDNITVLLNEKTVNDLLKICPVMFTIQSTVTYQALQQNVKVIILKEKYYWISEDILNADKVYLVNDWQEVKALLEKPETFQQSNTKPQSFFDPFNKKAFQKFLSDKGLSNTGSV